MIDTVSESGHVKIWKVNEDGYDLPEYEVFTDDSRAFHACFYGWALPVDHKYTWTTRDQLETLQCPALSQLWEDTTFVLVLITSIYPMQLSLNTLYQNVLNHFQELRMITSYAIQ